MEPGTTKQPAGTTPQVASKPAEPTFLDNAWSAIKSGLAAITIAAASTPEAGALPVADPAPPTAAVTATVAPAVLAEKPLTEEQTKFIKGLQASIEPGFKDTDGKQIFHDDVHLPALTGTGPEALRKFAAALDGIQGLSAVQKQAIMISMQAAAWGANYAEKHTPTAATPKPSDTAAIPGSSAPQVATTQGNPDELGFAQMLDNPAVKTALKMIDGSPAIRGCLANMVDGLAKMCSDPQMAGFLAPLLQLIGIDNPAQQLSQFATLLRSDKSFMPLVEAMAPAKPAPVQTGAGQVAPAGTGGAAANGTPMASGTNGTSNTTATFIAAKSEGKGDISTAINTTISATGLKFSAAEIGAAESTLVQIPEQFRGKALGLYFQGIKDAGSTPISPEKLKQIATTAVEKTFGVDPKASSLSTGFQLATAGTLDAATSTKNAFTAIGGIIQTASTEASQRQLAANTPARPSPMAQGTLTRATVPSGVPTGTDATVLSAANTDTAPAPIKVAAVGGGRTRVPAFPVPGMPGSSGATD